MLAAQSKRKADDLVDPLSRVAAFDYNDNLFDSAANREILIDKEKSRHKFAICHASHGECFHCVKVVAQDNAILRSSELKNNQITSGTKADILNTNYIEIGQSTPNACEDMSVEIFVG